ncbi:MAG: hypothetical protein IPM74_01400 [Crocinitomicaceae bacterium]|nr:hypothetical protein [Crocinitomicaceae bacterium]MBK8924572.1 hypothetical protein [Crocinitomicaceae bacterium]
MRRKKILIRFIFILGIVSNILLTACQTGGYRSFYKQKYLQGKLKPVYEESTSAENKTSAYALRNHSEQNEFNSDDSVNIAQFPIDAEKLSEEKISELQYQERLEDSTSKDLSISHEVDPTHQNLEEKNQINQTIKLPKLILNERKIPSVNPKSVDGSVALWWIVILALLAIIALPFAFLISFWAFVIAGVLLSAAVIILLCIDSSGGGDGILSGIFDFIALLAIVIVICVIIGLALIVALIWFIIWGLIQLFN